MNIILFETMPARQVIPGEDFRAQHIRKVLHLQKGDTFKLGILNGPSGTATISAIDQTGVSFDWTAGPSAGELHPVSLLVAQVRPICMKRILREAVSLGVQDIYVTGTDTAENSYGDAKLWTTGEYKKYLLDGAMQSGRTGMPTLHLSQSLDEFLQGEGSWATRLLLDNVPQAPPLSALDAVGLPVVLAVGPERGWTERERRLFRENGFASCSMGSRILRTETACSAGLAILLGRMRLI